MKRTLKQNNSLYLGEDKLATELNAKGLDMRVVLKPEFKIRWDKDAIHRNLVKPVAKAMYKVDSTTELTTGQISRVWEEIMQMLVDKFPDLDWVDFPSEKQTKNYYSSFKNEKNTTTSQE